MTKEELQNEIIKNQEYLESLENSKRLTQRQIDDLGKQLAELEKADEMPKTFEECGLEDAYSFFPAHKIRWVLGDRSACSDPDWCDQHTEHDAKKLWAYAMLLKVAGAVNGCGQDEVKQRVWVIEIRRDIDRVAIEPYCNLAWQWQTVFFKSQEAAKRAKQIIEDEFGANFWEVFR